MKHKLTYQVGVVDNDMDWRKMCYVDPHKIRRSPKEVVKIFKGEGKPMVHLLPDGSPYLIEVVWESDE